MANIIAFILGLLVGPFVAIYLRSWFDFFAIVAAIFAVSAPSSAHPVSAAFNVASVAPAAFGNMSAFDITCATTATPITGGGGFTSLACYTVSATSVFIGGSDVAASGFCVSTDDASCGGKGFRADIAHGVPNCRVAAGTVALSCIGVR